MIATCEDGLGSAAIAGYNTYSSFVNILPMTFLVLKMKTVITKAMISPMTTPVKAAFFAAEVLPAPSSLPTRIVEAVPIPRGT